MLWIFVYCTVLGDSEEIDSVLTTRQAVRYSNVSVPQIHESKWNGAFWLLYTVGSFLLNFIFNIIIPTLYLGV